MFFLSAERKSLHLETLLSNSAIQPNIDLYAPDPFIPEIVYLAREETGTWRQRVLGAAGSTKSRRAAPEIRLVIAGVFQEFGTPYLEVVKVSTWAHRDV